MSNGIALISPDADFSENPVGFVSVVAPPTLPAGVHTLLTFYKSIVAAECNRIGGEQMDVIVTRGSTRDLVFEADRLTTETVLSEIEITDFPLPYSTGFTVAIVTKFPDDNIRQIVKSSDFAEGPLSGDAAHYAGRKGWSIQLDSAGSRWYGTVTGADGTYRSHRANTLPVKPSGLFLLFHSYQYGAGNTGRSATYTPHEEVYSEGSVSTAATAGAPDPDAGIKVLPKQQALEYVDTASISMLAGWNRHLNQTEMDDAYDALKPWLAARGIAIA
jgi:hypothetical protein